MICPNCKNEISDSSITCGFCGIVLADHNSATLSLDGSYQEDNTELTLLGEQPKDAPLENRVMSHGQDGMGGLGQDLSLMNQDQQASVFQNDQASILQNQQQNSGFQNQGLQGLNTEVPFGVNPAPAEATEGKKTIENPYGGLGILVDDNKKDESTSSFKLSDDFWGQNGQNDQSRQNTEEKSQPSWKNYMQENQEGGSQTDTQPGGSAPAAPEPRKPMDKKLLKKILIGAAALAVVVCIVVMVIAYMPYISNMAHSSKSPEEYLQYVTEKQAKKTAQNASKIYGTYRECFANTYDNHIETKVNVGLEPVGKNLISLAGLSGIDLSWLNSMNMNINTNVRDSRGDFAFTFGFNGVDIMTLDTLLDTASGALYLKIPEASDKYLTTNVKYNSSMKDVIETAEKERELFKKINQVLPSEDVVNTLIYRYSTIAVQAAQNVEKTKTEISASGVTQKCTALSYEMDGAAMKVVLQNYVDAFQNDAEIRAIIEKTAAISGENAEDMINGAVKAMNDMLKSYDDETDVKLTATVYVDGKGDIIGVSNRTASEDTVLNINYLIPVKGSNAGFEYSVDSENLKIKLEGSGKKKGGKVSGTYTLSYNGTNLVDITTKNFDVDAFMQKGEVYGKFHVEMNSGLTQALEMVNVPSSVSGLAMDIDSKSALKNGSCEVVVWNSSNKLFTINCDWKQGKSTTIALPYEGDCMDFTRIAEYLAMADADKERNKELNQRLKKAKIPESLIRELSEKGQKLFRGNGSSLLTGY